MTDEFIIELPLSLKTVESWVCISIDVSVGDSGVAVNSASWMLL